MRAPDRRQWTWVLAWVIVAGLNLVLATPAGDDARLPTGPLELLVAQTHTPRPFSKQTLAEPAWVKRMKAADPTLAWRRHDGPHLVAPSEQVPPVPLPHDRPLRQRQYAWFMPQSRLVTGHRRSMRPVDAPSLPPAVKHAGRRRSGRWAVLATRGTLHTRSPPASLDHGSQLVSKRFMHQSPVASLLGAGIPPTRSEVRGRGSRGWGESKHRGHSPHRAGERRVPRQRWGFAPVVARVSMSRASLPGGMPGN